MIKRFSVRKILITSLLLIVALILYSFPEELETNINDVKYDSINIYLIDSNNYVAMTSIISNNDSFDCKLKTIIDGLTIGSSNIPKGFSPVIPKDTRLLDYDLIGGLLKINFSKELLNVTGDNEEKMIQSIIYSLTSLEDVEKIMIFVEGNKLDKLPNSLKKLDLYLDRSYGINKVIDIDTFSGTQMVTVYYLGNYDSFVPISYITDDDSERIEIIVNSLKSNRLNSSNLSSHLDYQVELMNYERIDDDFFINFSDSLFSSVYDGVLKEEVKYALSYSIFDSYDVKNVVFQINSNKIDELRLAK